MTQRTVEAATNDPLWHELQQWLTDHKGDTYFERSFKFGSKDDADADWADSTLPAFLTTGYGSVYYKAKGYPWMKVRRDKRETKTAIQLDSLSITFYCLSDKPVQKFYADLVARKEKDVEPKVRIFEGYWSQKGKPRDVMPPTSAAAKAFIADAKAFVAAEAEYEAKRRPHQKCYLLEGEPGTGKTSIVAYLSEELGYDIDSVKDLSDMSKALGGVGSGAILLIDDIDMTEAGGERAGKASKALRNLMNEIDGIVSRSLLIVATTNNKAALDPALLRNGRFGTHYMIGKLTAAEQVEHLNNYYLTTYIDAPFEPRTFADLQAVCDANMTDPSAAVKKLLENDEQSKIPTTI